MKLQDRVKVKPGLGSLWLKGGEIGKVIDSDDGNVVVRLDTPIDVYGVDRQNFSFQDTSLEVIR